MTKSFIMNICSEKLKVRLTPTYCKKYYIWEQSGDSIVSRIVIAAVFLLFLVWCTQKYFPQLKVKGAECLYALTGIS